MPPPKHTPAGWFVGESQLDPGEHGFDGTIWAPPSPEEQQDAAASAGEYEAEPYFVASGIRHEPYARLMAAAPDLLVGCEQFLALYDEALNTGRSVTFPGHMIDAMRAAVAKAKGE